MVVQHGVRPINTIKFANTEESLREKFSYRKRAKSLMTRGNPIV